MNPSEMSRTQMRKKDHKSLGKNVKILLRQGKKIKLFKKRLVLVKIILMLFC